ncbi:MAG TPA: helix-turn-helix transcriptional regulator [Mycobacteriales bacterium]|jgi:hypothetical protein|nr:helix-turn-helix transcriptional regulator [Mycobacteriales bacterium]
MTSTRAPGRHQSRGDLPKSRDDLPADAEDPVRTERFADAVKDTLEAAGISLRPLAARLGKAGFYIAPATLSDWKNGNIVPDRDGYTLDRLLALARETDADAGRLVAAYHQTAPGPWDLRRRARHPLAPATDESDPTPLKATLEARGCTNEGAITLVDAAEHLQIGSTRRPRRSDLAYRALVLQPGVRRYWVRYTVDDQAPTTIMAGDRCTIGTCVTARGPGYHVRAVELRLDRTYDVGATAEFGFAILTRPPEPDPGVLSPPGWFRVVTDPACRRLCVDLSFDPHERPASVRQVVWEKDTRADDPDGAPVGSPDGHFHWEVLDPLLTAYGYVWTWPGPLDLAAPPWGGAR